MSSKDLNRLPYVQVFRDRYGAIRYYYRRRGFDRVALPGTPDTEEFQRAYQKAAASAKAGAKGKIEPRSIQALANAYYQSPAFDRLGATTKRNYKAVLNKFAERWGDRSALALTSDHIDAILGQVKNASNLRKRLAQMYDFAVAQKWRHDNPARAAKPPKKASGGFRAWDEEDVAKFEAAYPAGTREHLALYLLIYTGQRRSDIVAMGRQSIKAGRMTVIQFKGRAREGGPTQVTFRVHPALKAELARVPAGQVIFLHNRYGVPFSHAGFTNWFADAAEKAGLPGGCTPHGLRKAACRRLAEAGCTAHEIMSITGHKTLKEVDRYTQSVRQQAMADAAMTKLEAQDGNV